MIKFPLPFQCLVTFLACHCRFFVQEVSHFVDSEDIVGLHNIHGAVHLLGALTKCE